MSKRTRERKARKIETERAIRTELKERQRMRTAGLRKWTKAISLMLAGLVVVAGFVFGAVVGINAIDKAISKTITGPFGTIAKTELNDNRFATINTSQGDIKIELDTKRTPNTAANFVLLARKNFYDGIRFHRVIKDFMIQTGDPNSRDDDPSNDGTGSPGYQFDNEKIIGDYIRGTVAMANAGENTNGSQFFIMQQDKLSMPKKYVIFGKVVSGMDVVDKIAGTPVENNDSGEASRPKTAITINKVTLSKD
jgi:cyclophilin family peptidyl-prolyl cis-trans isomerase